MLQARDKEIQIVLSSRETCSATSTNNARDHNAQSVVLPIMSTIGTLLGLHDINDTVTEDFQHFIYSSLKKKK